MQKYIHIKSVIDSMLHSTNLTIKLYDCSYSFFGLNSPYISKSIVEIEKGHELNIVILQNDKYILVVDDLWRNSYEVIEGKLAGMDFPKSEILPIFWRVHVTPPEWMTTAEKDIMHISYPDFFSGYDTEGKPQYHSRKTTIGSGYITIPISEEETRINPATEEQEHRHQGAYYWHPIDRKHKGD